MRPVEPEERTATEGPPGSRRLETAVLGAAVSAVGFLFAFSRIFDNDVWWHLATGRWMLENGRVPTADPFSFATSGAPWVPHSWLAEIGMALAVRAGGLDALGVLKAVVVAAAFALTFRAAVRSGAPPWLAAFALALSAPVAHFQFRERPAVAMFLLDAVFFWRLAVPGSETSRRTWLVLVPSMVLWVNVHGSFFLGVVLAGCLLVDRLAAAGVARVRGVPGPGRRSLLAAAGLVAALAAATLVSPFGPELPRQILHDFTTLAVNRTFVIEEHLPLDWRAYPGFTALAGATLASFLAAGRGARVYAFAAFACVNELARRSVRFAGIAALVDAGILCLNLAPLAARLAGRVRFPPRLRAAILAPALAAVAAFGFRSSFTEFSETQLGLGVNEARFPVGATSLLERSRFSGNLFNTWDFGGYLLWRLPAARDFIDGRTLPAQLALLERLYTAMDADGVARWIADHDVKAAVLRPSDPFALIFEQSPLFELAYLDDVSVVFLRAGDPSSPARQLRLVRLGANDPERLATLASGPDAAAAEQELITAVAETNGSAIERIQLGTFRELRRDPRAVDDYLAAARRNPRLFFADRAFSLHAARAALAHGRADGAEWLARRALEIHAGDPELRGVLDDALRRARGRPGS